MKTTSLHSTVRIALVAFGRSHAIVWAVVVALLGTAEARGQYIPALQLGTTNLLEGPAAGADSVVLGESSTTAAWSATANAPWLHLSAANQNGAGPATVVFTFDANPGATRTGAVTIAGQTVTVTQAASTYVAARPVTTLVSSGLFMPRGVAVDGAGNVYIADGSGVVKEWVAANNTVSTVVSGMGLIKPWLLALGAEGLFISDAEAGGGRVWGWTPDNPSKLTDVANVTNVTGVALDSEGDVYVSRQGPNIAEELWTQEYNFPVPPNCATTLVSGMSVPNGIAVDAAGNVYVADGGNYVIHEWIQASGAVTIPVSGETYFGVAVDGGGNVYVTGSGGLQEWSASTGSLTTFTNGLYGGVTVDGAGNVYFANDSPPALEELPRAFVDTTTRHEALGAGADRLPVVLPATANLQAPFVPTSDSSWLNITGITNGVVSFSFSSTTTNRTGHITLLGQAIPVTQAPTLGTTNLLEGPASGTDSVVLAISPKTATWSATANASWLHLSSANQSGAGPTNVIFTFDTDSGATRVGTLTIGGQTVTVMQAGANYVASPVITLTSLPGNARYGLAVDMAGDAYIDDSNDGTLLRWTPTSGLSTLVSSGLSTPRGLAVDGTGNAYIADWGHNEIQEWVAANRTLSPLVSALNQPRSVAVDAGGAVYIADTGNSAIKKWPPPSGPVSTLVSSGINSPQGVAVDAAGNVYVSDTGNNLVKEWFPTSGPVTPLLSNSLAGPYGIAVDGSGNAYVADFNNSEVKCWVAATGANTIVISNGLSYPEGVAVDGAGNLYIADSGHNLLKALPRAYVNPTAKVESPFGGGDVLPAVLPTTAALDGVFAPTSDSSWLTITGVANGVISFGFTGTTSNRTGHITVLGMAISIMQQIPTLGTTNLLVAPDAGMNSVVLGVSPASATWTATANASWLHLSAANQSGTGSTNVSFRIDANPGATRSGTLTIAGQTLTVTQAGSTYVAAPAPVTTLASSPLSGSYGLAVDGVGNVYIADTGHSAVKEWSLAGNTVTTLVSSGLSAPQAVAVDGAGNVYIADTGDSAIKKWAAPSGPLTSLVSSGLHAPAGIAVDSAGNLYFSDYYNNAIKEWFAASGVVTNLVSTGLNGPTGVAVDSAGNVYFSDYNNKMVKEWLAANGSVAPVVSTGLSGPYGLAVDGSGNVYIADAVGNDIQEWIAVTGSVTNLVPSSLGLKYPAGVAVDGWGNVSLADTQSNAVKELPRAFVVPTARAEGLTAGTDSLPVVLPTNANLSLSGPFAPTSNQSWLAITGVTNGVISFSFTATTTTRTGNITVLGVSVPITQINCLGAPNLVEGPASGADSVALTASGVWSATANATWLHLSAGSQSGTNSATVAFTFDQNTGPTRTGTLTIDGLTLTVTQAGSTYVAAPAVTNAYVDPTARVEGGGAGNDALPPVLPATANLTGTNAPSADQPWLSIAGVNNGVVSFSFTAANTNRTGHISLLGTNVAITQQIAFSLGATNLPEGPGPGGDSVSLTVDSPVGTWTATSTATWLHVSGGSQSGAGSAMVTFAFDANTGSIRTGTLAVAGLTVTVTQAGATYVPAQMFTNYVFCNSPRGVAVDTNGNVYIADTGDNAIKVWNPSNLSVTNLAFPWFDPELNQPGGVAVGYVNSYLAVCVADDDTLSVYYPTLGFGQTVGGSSGPEGVAMDPYGFVYIADTINNAIDAYDLDDYSFTTLFSQGLNLPGGVAVESNFGVYNGSYYNDILFIADTLNNAIEICYAYWGVPVGNVNTLVSQGLNLPGGVAVDNNGGVYIADTFNNAIKKCYVINGVVVGSVNTLVSNGLNHPYGVAVDTSNNVFIADTGNNAIKMYNPATQSLTTLGSLTPALTNAYVDAVEMLEGGAAGTDALAPVVPATANLTGTYAPTSDSSWLTITGVANGVVSFSFTATTTSRVGHITVLGVNVPVIQSPTAAVPPPLLSASIAGNCFQFAVSNATPSASLIILSATNLAVPASNWNVVCVSNFLPTGLIPFSVPLGTNEPQRFYQLKSP